MVCCLCPYSPAPSPIMKSGWYTRALVRMLCCALKILHRRAIMKGMGHTNFRSRSTNETYGSLFLSLSPSPIMEFGWYTRELVCMVTFVHILVGTHKFSGVRLTCAHQIPGLLTGELCSAHKILCQ